MCASCLFGAELCYLPPQNRTRLPFYRLGQRDVTSDQLSARLRAHEVSEIKKLDDALTIESNSEERKVAFQNFMRQSV
jgi:hypothetical protein